MRVSLDETIEEKVKRKRGRKIKIPDKNQSKRIRKLRTTINKYY